MALIPSARYPSQVDAAAGYPHGKARDATTFHDGSGTAIAKDWINDLWGFLQSLLAVTGAAPSGFPDQLGASQYLDALTGIISGKADAAESTVKAYVDQITDRAPLRLRPLGPSGVSSTEQIGAISSLDGTFTIIGKNALSRLLYRADDSLVAGGAPPTSSILSMARNGARILAVGDTSSPVISTNEGATWSTGNTLGSGKKAREIIYLPVHLRFLVTYAFDANVANDLDGVSTWSIVATTLASGQGGIAAFDTGDVVVCGLDGASAVAFSRSIDGGVVWANAPTVPNAAAYGDSGTVIGDGGARIYHAGRVGISEIRICSASVALDWQLRATLATPAAVSGKPRILLCPDTGALVVVVPVAGETVASLSRDHGVTWSPFARYRTRLTTGFALAAGRLLATAGSAIQATDDLI